MFLLVYWVRVGWIGAEWVGGVVFTRIQANLFVWVAWKNRPEFVVDSFGEIVCMDLTVIKKNIDFDQAVQIQQIVFEDFVVKLLLICVQFF